MRHIGNLPEEQLAERFAAYLITLGIAPHVELAEEGWEVWVKEEDHVEVASQHLARFRRDPAAAEFQGAVSRAAGLLREQLRRQQVQQRNVRDIRTRWTGKSAAPVTWTLILVAAVVTLVTYFGRSQDALVFRVLAFNVVDHERYAAQLAQAAGQDPPPRPDRDAIGFRMTRILQGELWRLFTPIFLHFGIFHILFNAFMLFQLGRLIEVRFGTGQMLLLTLASAAIPNALQGIMPEVWGGSAPSVVSAEHGISVTLFGGLSGMVYALFGFLWITSMLDRRSGLMMPPLLVVLLIGWMLLGFTDLPERWWDMRMANWGHGGGLAVGCALAVLRIQIRQLRRPSTKSSA